MKTIMVLGLAGLGMLTLPPAPAAHAQAGNYPDKPVTIIADAAPGATPDVDARFVAEGLSKIWGQQVIVINHPGANGSIAARTATEAAPDGYTLFMPALSTFVALPSVAPNLPLKLPRDFLPIGYTAENPMFFAVNAVARRLDAAGTDRARQKGTGQDFDRGDRRRPAHASDRPGVSGSRRHQAAAGALQRRAGGGARRCRRRPRLDDHRGLFGNRRLGQSRPGEADRGGVAASACRSFPICRQWRKRSRAFAATGWQVLVAPLGTPAPIVSKVSADLAKVVSDPDFKKRLEQHRQLFARHDARAGSRLRAEGAGHLAAGAAEDFGEVS